VPDNDAAAGEFAALLINEAVDVAAPLACGVKVMLNDVL
jgi:hypothetical protein